LLFIAVTAMAEPPPEIEWEKTYFPGYWSVFESIIETQDGGYAATISVSTDTSYAMYKLSQNGDILWSAGADIDGQGGRYIIELENSDLVVAGWGRETPTSSTGVMIAKYTCDGDELWTNIYQSQYPGSEIVYSITSLPDGGFAIAGEINPTEGMNQAWILRTDSQGDTLWTREWGWEAWDRARGVLYIDNAITVLCSGRLEGDPGGTYIVRYSLDGDLLSEYRIPEMQGQYGWDMCRASDGGLLIVNNSAPSITHTDYLGNYNWSTSNLYAEKGTSIKTTMDGGILFGGYCVYQSPGEFNVTDNYGVITRLDSSGNYYWSDNIYNSGCVTINSISQLSQGGYIAAGEAFSPENGVQGFLIKYAPELGIESSNYPSIVSINSIAPNPLSSSAVIQFSLVEAGTAKLTLYDLNGREIGIISEGVFAGGTNTVNWHAPDGLSNGCYLMRLETTVGNDASHLIVLK